MKRVRIMSVAAAAAFSLLSAGTAEAQSDASASSSDAWTWRATLYGWFPSIHSKTNVEVPGQGTVNIDVKPGTYLSNLEFAFMGNLEARKGPWSFIGDAVYFDFGNTRSDSRTISGPGGMPVPVTANSHTDIKGVVGSFGGGYSLLRTPTANADLVAGARYLRLKVDVDLEIIDPLGNPLTSGNLNRTKDVWDGVVGVRGQTGIGGNWFVPYHADIGAGTSRFTWQAFAGVGYRFDWGDVTLGYRHTAYRFDNDNPVSELAFGGPLLGIGFRF